MRTLASIKRWWWAAWIASLAGAPADPPRTEPPAPPPAPSPPPDAAPALPFPHPLITEVLFAVPTGPDGDANKDGTRQVAGDEFIEIVNPHARPINLAGYTLTDGAPNPKSQLRFTFPNIHLPPHAVVVVFNGHDSKIPGPVGDARKAPASTNERFAKAAVFTMRTPSSRISFSNAGDAACLLSPDRKPLQRIRWGKADEKAGGVGFLLDELAPTTSKSSVQRDTTAKDGLWKLHTDLDATPFSPGAFPFATPPDARPADQPAERAKR